MDQLPNYGDRRQTGFCAYCGGSTETRDHAPSRIFLDKPHPDYLPVVPCCEPCNQSFSADEEYLAAFVECLICGATEPDRISRDKIRSALANNPRLRERIELSRHEADTSGSERQLLWQPEAHRVENVILKLARGHAAYELNEPQLEKPTHILIGPLEYLSNAQRRQFESPPDTGGVWPEVGSRALQRLLIYGSRGASEGWVCVQRDRYRYMAVGAGDVMIRGVISEYLGFEVIWRTFADEQ